MKFEDFIKDFENSNNKELFVSKQLKTQYVSYQEKVSICKAILEASHYKEIDKKKYFKLNTPAESMLFDVRLFITYIDVETDDITPLDLYNELIRADVMKYLEKVISKEYSIFTILLSQMRDDIIADENSIVAFLSTKFDAINKLWNITEPVLTDKIVELSKK